MEVCRSQDNALPGGPSDSAETLRCPGLTVSLSRKGLEKENHLLPPDAHKQDWSSQHSRAVLKGL